MRFSCRFIRLALLAAVPMVGACGGDGGSDGGADGGVGERVRAARDTAGAAEVMVAPVPSDTGAPADTLLPPLTAHGWGSLRIGMSREEVVAAVGGDANPEAVGGPEPEVCDEWRPARAPKGLMVMVQHDTLTRITLLNDSEVGTRAGVHVGDPASAVRSAYGAEAEETPHKYLDSPGAYITVWTSDPDSPDPRGLVYVIGREETVTHVHAGDRSITYVEGCL